MDGPADDWRIGFMAGYSRSLSHTGGNLSSGSSDDYHFGVYGGTEKGNLAFRSGLAHTWHELDIRRSVVVPGFNDRTTARYHGGTTQVFGEFGYGFDAGAVRLEPYANLAHVGVQTRDFAEQGGAAALTGRNEKTAVTFTTLGLHAETNGSLGRVAGRLRGTLGWRRAFGDTVSTAMQALAGSDGFSVAGAPIAKNSAVIEAGLDLNPSPSARVGLSYIGQLASGARAHGAKAYFEIRF